MIKYCKKIVLGVVGSIMVYTGGIGSCHYTLSHHHYSPGEYDKCLYHAQKAGRHFPPYNMNAYQYTLDRMLENMVEQYNDCEDYYAYYLHEQPKIPWKVKHLKDNYFVNQLGFIDRCIADNSSEYLFFFMHRSVRGNVYEIKRFEWYRKKVLYDNPITSTKYSKLIRRFVHMLAVSPFCMRLVFASWKNDHIGFEEHMEEIEKNMNRVVDYMLLIKKEDDYLLHLEYGLVCSNIVQVYEKYSIKEKEVRKHIEEPMDNMYEAIKTVKETLLEPHVKEDKNLLKGIRYMQHVLDTYNK